MSDWNNQIIDEFRATGGKPGGFFQDKPLLLLHHIGAKTRTERVSPLAYLPVDGGYAVFASKGGADTNPDWLHNLNANPDVKIEVGTETIAVTARVAGTEERMQIWNRQKQAWPQFGEYEVKTARDHIPVIVLEPAN